MCVCVSCEKSLNNSNNGIACCAQAASALPWDAPRQTNSCCRLVCLRKLLGRRVLTLCHTKPGSNTKQTTKFAHTFSQYCWVSVFSFARTKASCVNSCCSVTTSISGGCSNSTWRLRSTTHEKCVFDHKVNYIVRNEMFSLCHMEVPHSPP